MVLLDSKTLLQNSDGLIYWVIEAVKVQIKKQVGGFLGMLLGTLGASMLGCMLTGKGVTRAGKGVVRAGRGYNNIDYMEKKLLAPSFK